MSATKRDQQRIDRRKQILSCSLDMIISRGYESMKIRDIAEKLDISTGLFFNYFESKEKIYEELIKIGLSGPENVFKLYSEEIEPIDYFEKITGVIFESLKSYSMSARIFLLMAQTMNFESAPESVKKLVAQFDAFTPVIPVVQKGQRLGQIKQGEPAALLIAYWGAVQGVAQTYASRPELPLPESTWIVDILRA